MKLITAAIFIVFFFSCRSKVSTFDVYLELRDKAVASTHKTDTTLLKFRFGMNREEVKNKLKELEADGTIYFDKNENVYCYVLNTGRSGDAGKIYCAINPGFYKDELYILFFNSYKKGNSKVDGESDFSGMNSFLANKYGDYSVSFWPAKDCLSPFNVWLINNTEFMIYQTKEGATLQCADLIREKEKGGW